MKAVRILEPGVVRLVETEVPEPPAGFVRVRVKAAAVCATDLEVIDGNIPADYPLIPGHEWSGIVDAAGDPSDEKWLGRAVAGSNDVICRICPACLRGEWRYCKSFEEIGFRRDGAYAEYVIVPAYGLCGKPENVSFECAALCEPLGVALGSLKKAHAKPGQTMAVLGAGSIGLCMLAAGRVMGLRRITVCASGRGRLPIAEKMGAFATIAMSEQDIFETLKKLHPDGTDIVVDATGIETCIQTALKLPRKGGKVILAGYGRGKTMSIRIDDIHINNLKVIGAGNNWNMHSSAIRLMEDGLVDLSPMVTDILELEEFERGIRLARTRPAGFVKAVFRFE